MHTFKSFISEDRIQSILEASSGISYDDLWKRDNLQRFIDKATSGDLVDSSNNKIPSITSNNELIQVIKTFDTPPKDEDLINFKKLFKDNIGSFSKIPKAENGFSTSSGTPTGAQWEALIAIGVNKIKNREWNMGPEWESVGKFWGDYEIPSMKLGKEFIEKIKVDELKQLGGGTAITNSNWRGTNKTPKTDIIGTNKKISLKKASGGQLMSAGTAEAISTFEAAMSMYSMDSKGKKKVESVMTAIELEMGKMSTKGTIGSVENLRDSGKNLSAADKAKIEEMEGLQLNAKSLTTKLEKLFSDEVFKSYFCWEAATGTTKFKPSADAIANVIVKFQETGSIKEYLILDSAANAGKTLAKGNNFFVSFKTGNANSKPYLSLRSKNVKAIKNNINEQVTLKQIIKEEIEKEEILSESFSQQLDEFALWNKIKSKVKGAASNIVSAVKRIYTAVMKRISEAFNYIKTLGEKMISGLLNFLGLSVSKIKVSGGGKFPL